MLFDGEEEKNWVSLMKIYDCLLVDKCDCKIIFIVLGGGVIGDLIGFVVVFYMCGVFFV